MLQRAQNLKEAAQEAPAALLGPEQTVVLQPEWAPGPQLAQAPEEARAAQPARAQEWWSLSSSAGRTTRQQLSEGGPQEEVVPREVLAQVEEWAQEEAEVQEQELVAQVPRGRLQKVKEESQQPLKPVQEEVQVLAQEPVLAQQGQPAREAGKAKARGSRSQAPSLPRVGLQVPTPPPPHLQDQHPRLHLPPRLVVVLRQKRPQARTQKPQEPGEVPQQVEQRVP